VFLTGDRISISERLSTYVENWFDNHGVEMIINSNITRVEESVLYNHEEPVSSDIIVWTAGIQPNRLFVNWTLKKTSKDEFY
jgi:NADH dehydrogenase